MVAQFVTEIFEVFLAQTPFEKGARIYARRGVTLEVDEIARFGAPVGGRK